MQTITSVEEQVIRRLRAAGDIDVEPGGPDDLVVAVRGGEARVRLEIKHRFDGAVLDEIAVLPRNLKERTVLAVPTLSARRREELRTRGISWIEYRTGRVHLRVPGLAIELPEAVGCAVRAGGRTESCRKGRNRRGGADRHGPRAGGRGSTRHRPSVREHPSVDEPRLREPGRRRSSRGDRTWAAQAVETERRGASGPVDRRRRPCRRGHRCLPLGPHTPGSPAVPGRDRWGRCRLRDRRRGCGESPRADADHHSPRCRRVAADPDSGRRSPLPSVRRSSSRGPTSTSGRRRVIPRYGWQGLSTSWRSAAPAEFRQLRLVSPGRAVVEALQDTGRAPEVGENLRRRIIKEAEAHRDG